MSDLPFTARPYHRRWLLDQAQGLLTFFGPQCIDAGGGFHVLDDAGHPLPAAPQELFYTCRMIHCHAAGHLMGHPGAMRMVDHGMRALLDRHLDPAEGGFFWSVTGDGPVRAEKLAYGHAFVLLAAASAQDAGHPDAAQLHDLVWQVLLDRFWDNTAGALREEFTRDWHPLSEYRGQNANMHGAEALMAAYESFGDPRALSMAERIADLIINRHARSADWVVLEHFDAQWTPDRAYAGDPMFRPAGTTPGHALEWARLLVQLWHLGGKRHDWMPDAATQLFRAAVTHGWDPQAGGFYYTLHFDNRADQDLRLWWPACEGAAAAAVLQATSGDPEIEEWYRRIWATLTHDFIDPAGGWWPVARNGGKAADSPFVGKPDIYHALQACLIPLVSPQAGLMAQLRRDPGIVSA